MRVTRIELTSEHWQCPVITIIRYPQFVDRMGIEPTTETLRVFLAEALEHASPYVVRVTGIEPTSPTWKAGVITIIRYPHICRQGGYRTHYLVCIRHMLLPSKLLAEIKKPSPFETGFEIYVIQNLHNITQPLD